MELKLKHAAIDDFIGEPVTKLREINADAEAIKTAVQAELKRQADEALEALKETGYEIQDSTPVTEAAKRRGRRTNAEIAADAQAKIAADLKVDPSDDAAPVDAE